MNPPVESALIVTIREAEAVVAPFRQRYDPAAALGLPAHVTVLYPFKAPADLSLGVHQALATLFAKLPAFRVTFTEVRRFPEVLYLAPHPDEPFRHLTERVATCFPETPPYGGKFPDIVPHLTLAHSDDAKHLEAIASAFARDAGPRLPIQATVTEVALMDNEIGRWSTRAWFTLGGGRESIKSVFGLP